MKKKVKIESLEVQSFVTTLSGEEKNKVKGAIMSTDDLNDACHSYDNCVNTDTCGGGSWVCTVNCQTGGNCTVYTANCYTALCYSAIC